VTGRLAYLVSRFPRLSETFIVREMLELEQRGWSIDLCSIIHERASTVHPEAAQIEPRVLFLDSLSSHTIAANRELLLRSPGLYARLLTTTLGGNLRSPAFLAKALYIFPGAIELAARLRARRIDHLHAQFGSHPGLLALLAAETLGIGFSFHVRAVDLFVDTTMLVEKIRRARFVVAISEFNRRRLRELAGELVDQKVVVIRNGLDLERYRFRARTPSPRQASLLAVGSLLEYKGHEYLVEACALLRAAQPDSQFRCDIVGEGPHRAKLQSLIAQHHLEGTVSLLGARDQHDVRSMMDQADVLVLPSVIARNGSMEGLPNVLIEAMALGLPVISTNISGIPELVHDGETGLLVPEKDSAALRDAILQVWHSPEKALSRAERGRALVEQNHDARTNAPRLETLFSQAIGTAPASQIAR
jgi:colanic acid/amylovoran biosynthesis glycosyltransferase